MVDPKKKSKELGEKVEITPLRDHEIHFNKIHHDIKKGVKIKVEKIFLQNLKTEKVI